MALKQSDLRLIGSAVMPDDDTPTNIGGAADPTIHVSFADVANVAMQARSSDTGDTTQTVTVSYRDSDAAIQTQAFALNGRTVVTQAGVMERLLKAVKSATCAGDVSIESQTAERTGTAQAFDTADTIKLDSGASAVTNAYAGMVLCTTGGTGNYQIRRILAYDGATKIVTINRAWDTNPDATTTFRIAKGFVFEHDPTEVLEVRRVFYDAAADPDPGGSAVTYYEKVFWENTHATIGLVDAIVQEQADPSDTITFGVAAAVDDTGDNGAFNRQTAPGGVTFDSADKAIPGADLAAGSAIGVWLKLSRPAGALKVRTTYGLAIAGSG